MTDPSGAEAGNLLTNAASLFKGLDGVAVNAFKASLNQGAANNPDFNPFNPGTWGSYVNSIKQAAPTAIIDKLKKEDKNYAKVFSDPVMTNQLSNAVLTNNWGDAAATLTTGSLVPGIANALTSYATKKVKRALGITPPAPADPTVGEAGLADFYPSPTVAATRPSDKTVNDKNVGHEAYMSVTLGGLSFEIPPAVQSMLPVGNHGSGHDTPGVGAGISFRHMQNYATMLIPGSSPVYQSLGIQGHMIEFVGVFLGFNKDRLLDAEKTGGRNVRGTGFKDNFDATNPDPLYTNTLADTNVWGRITLDPPGPHKGGAWGISKAFQENVRNGIPQSLIIYSGVTEINYTVIVIGLDRVYQRDDRVYYKFQGLAVSGEENVTANTKVTPVKNILTIKTTENYFNDYRQALARENKEISNKQLAKDVRLSLVNTEIINRLKEYLGDPKSTLQDYNYARLHNVKNIENKNEAGTFIVFFTDELVPLIKELKLKASGYGNFEIKEGKIYVLTPIIKSVGNNTYEVIPNPEKIKALNDYDVIIKYKKLILEIESLIKDPKMIALQKYYTNKNFKNKDSNSIALNELFSMVNDYYVKFGKITNIYNSYEESLKAEIIRIIEFNKKLGQR